MELVFEELVLPALLPPDGAHRLAWSYLLDRVVADAYHAGAARLRVQLPAVVRSELEARLEVTPVPASARGEALFWIGAPPATRPVTVALRRYRLRFGALAPPALRTAGGRAGSGAVDPTAPPDDSLRVLTVATRAWGIPLRLCNQLGWPHLADRALLLLRRNFATRAPLPCYYLLEQWHAATDPDQQA